MIQTEQQEAVAGSAGPRKDWELFWRIIAGLMLLVIAWVLWVLYQITPRSVVTPLAFANPIRPIGAQAQSVGAPAPAPPQPASAPLVPPPAATAATAADTAAMERTQAAMRAGAHQASADVQVTAPANTEAQIQGVGLRLATEITPPPADVTPPPAKPGSLNPVAGQSGDASAAGAAGKARP